LKSSEVACLQLIKLSASSPSRSFVLCILHMKTSVSLDHEVKPEINSCMMRKRCMLFRYMILSYIEIRVHFYNTMTVYFSFYNMSSHGIKFLFNLCLLEPARNIVNPWSRILAETIVAQPVVKFLDFCGTRSFIFFFFFFTKSRP
jgi:hypothetical protein